MRRIEDLKTPVESSVSGRRTKRLPSSLTSVCTPCSIEGRSLPASRSARAARSWCTRRWAWSPRFSTRTPSTHWPVRISPSATAASVWMNAQPTFRPTATGGIALGHNGNLTNTLELREWLSQRDQAEDSLLPGSLLNEATNDTSLITALLATFSGLSTEEAAIEVLPRLRGAFSLVFMDEETLYAARDPQGIRPLVLGRLERGWVVASETAALDIVGATFIRE